MKKIKLLLFAFTFFTLNMLFTTVNIYAQNSNKFIQHDKHGIKDQYIVSLRKMF